MLNKAIINVFFICNIITPVFERFKTNGSIARNGTLSDNDKIQVQQVFGTSAAVESIEQNGYYFKILARTPEDINLRRVRVIAGYLASGVVNKVMITNNIYGA